MFHYLNDKNIKTSLFIKYNVNRINFYVRKISKITQLVIRCLLKNVDKWLSTVLCQKTEKLFPTSKSKIQFTPPESIIFIPTNFFKHPSHISALRVFNSFMPYLATFLFPWYPFCYAKTHSSPKMLYS